MHASYNSTLEFTIQIRSITSTVGYALYRMYPVAECGEAWCSDVTGGSACEASMWLSDSGVECKLSAGAGGGAPMRQGQGLPVVVTLGLPQGSRTQA